MDLDRTAEARRKAQRNGEEDPVVVAQRFLNIYRQIHIFNAEKKAAFNKMLLELPPQIRGMFGQLPGGAMLQDYVDELAEKEGIEKAQHSAADIADEDVKQAKILATALAEAQVQASAKMQGMAAAPISPSGGATVSASPAGTTRLSMDKNFAQEFASVLATAMQKNSASQENEIKNIINTLGQTQLEIIKVLQEENAEHREEMKKISQMMLQTQSQISDASASSATQPQAPQKISEETKQLIKILLSSQQQLLERITRVETKAASDSPIPGATPQKSADFSEKAAMLIGQNIAMAIEKNEKNVSDMIIALQKRQQSDTLEIARLINESQQNLMNIMMQHNSFNQNQSTAANNNANNIQINTADYSLVLNRIADQLSQLVPQSVNQTKKEKEPRLSEQNIQITFPEDVLEKLVGVQSQTYQKIATQQTKELSKIISLAVRESQKASTQTLIEALAARPIIVDGSSIVRSDSLRVENAPYFDNKESTVIEPVSEQQKSDISPEPAETQQEEIVESVSQDALSTFVSEQDVVAVEATGTPLASLQSSNANSSGESADKKQKKKKKKKKKKGALPQEEINSELAFAEEFPHAGSVDDDLLSLNTGNESITSVSQLSSLEELEQAPTSYTIPTETSPTADLSLLSSEEKKDDTEETKFADEQSEKTVFLESEEDSVLSHRDSPDDWGFSSAPETKGASNEDSQAWEWVYEEVPSEKNEASGKGVEWEWDYIPEDSPLSNDGLQPLAPNCPIYSGDLFFQRQDTSSRLLAEDNTLPVFKYHPGIFDSATTDQQKDPYKNSSLKD